MFAKKLLLIIFLIGITLSVAIAFLAKSINPREAIDIKRKLQPLIIVRE